VFILFLIVSLGGLLRFWDLGLNPLWIDEAYFARIVRGDMDRPQEYITVMVAQLFNLRSEFGLRFMFALAGTLTIPAIYFIVKNNKSCYFN
jgi:4-amino-4-deoxy-L-arabinose transferase-like glycosyltransferase